MSIDRTETKATKKTQNALQIFTTSDVIKLTSPTEPRQTTSSHIFTKNRTAVFFSPSLFVYSAVGRGMGVKGVNKDEEKYSYHQQ